MSAAKRKVDLDAVAERCERLKLTHIAECLPELVEEASRKDLAPVTFLGLVLEREIERKDERRVATSTLPLNHPYGVCHPPFSCSHATAHRFSSIRIETPCVGRVAVVIYDRKPLLQTFPTLMRNTPRRPTDLTYLHGQRTGIPTRNVHGSHRYQDAYASHREPLRQRPSHCSPPVEVRAKARPPQL